MNFTMKKTLLTLIVALCAMFVGCSEELISVRVVRIEPATPGFNGHSSYTVVENLLTQERLWVRGNPGAVGDVIKLPVRSVNQF